MTKKKADVVNPYILALILLLLALAVAFYFIIRSSSGTETVLGNLNPFKYG